MGKHTRKATQSSPPASPPATGRRPASPGSPGDRKRRASRPVDRRLKMRDWLVNLLNAGDLQDVLWWKQKEKVFAVKWTHAARHGFSVTDDTKLTRAWALHSGVFQEGDQEDHKKWKSNFRCALHSLPDVKEVGPTEKRKGQNAFRLYELLDKPEAKKRKNPSGSTVRKRFVLKTEETSQKDGTDSDSGQSTATEPSDSSTTPPHIPAPADYSIPDFNKLGLNMQGMMTSSVVQTNHLSGGLVIKKEQLNADGLSAMGGTAMTLASSFFPIPVPAVLRKMTPSSSSILLSSNGICETPQGTDDDQVEEEKEEEEDEDTMMCPVGIMTCTRVRTPSGDSGHPNSPNYIEEAREENEIQVLQEIADLPGNGGMYIIHDENGTVAFDSEDMDWDNFDLMSSGCPRAVAVQEIVASEDFTYAGLSTMESVV